MRTVFLLTFTLFAFPVLGDSLVHGGSFTNGLLPWTLSFGTDEAVQHVQVGDKGHIRILCKDTVGGIDAPRLRVGRDIYRRGTYQLRARIRNEGITQGGFGMRLYCYDGAGQLVSMQSTMSIGTGQPPHGWETRTCSFGHDTKLPIPLGTTVVVLRFSLWGEGSKATGAVCIDDVILTATSAAGQTKAVSTALVWRDMNVEKLSGRHPVGVEDALRAAKLKVVVADTASLLGDGAVDVQSTSLLVLPYGAVYPVALIPSLVQFLSEGGALMALGGPSFTRPFYMVDGSPAELHAAATGGSTPIALAPEWPESNSGKTEPLVVKSTKESHARFRVDGLKTYSYAGKVVAAPDFDSAVLEVEVRGGRRTPRLCLEFRATDGSRWKHVLPLTRRWHIHRVHLAEFASYASPERADAQDWLRASEVETLLVGFTASMVGKGDHSFEVRNARFLPAAVPGEKVRTAPPLPVAETNLTQWFGKNLSPPPGAVGLRSRPTSPFREKRLWMTGKRGKGAKGVWTGRLVGEWDSAADTDKMPRRNRLAARFRKANEVRRFPLLEVGRKRQCAAALFLHVRGPFAGARWAAFGLDQVDLSAAPPLRQAVIGAAQFITRGIHVSTPVPVFRATPEGVEMDVVVNVQNPGGHRCDLRTAARIGWRTANGRRLATEPHEIPLALDGGETLPTPFVIAQDISMQDLNWQTMTIEAITRTSVDQPIIKEAPFQLDTRAALRTIADFMVAEAADDGKLHGYSFIDNRGMRALLGAYELFGDKNYLKTALAWGDVMIKEQREDGGYRMGYGVRSNGDEECYVADGGEIAVGMARLISYSKSRRRKRLQRSLDAYMEYRESFRVQTGGLGVGWCLRDYGKRPIVSLDKPTRIFAPEINTYTIGCSLAAAYVHAHLQRSGKLENRAAGDGKWLMERGKRLNGAFIESYLYAHQLTTHPQHRKAYADYIDEVFTSAMVGARSNQSWWLSGGGRTALNLDGLAYVQHELEGDGKVQAELMRATCAMFSNQSPESMLKAIVLAKRDHDAWIYICYGAMSLADVIQPMVTMDDMRPAADR
ncbi:MAG: hypothetical protein KAI66_00060 [Lentisphaeria bacterium]|nr:hypothetical protein [Lentisphaeria bacterium]